MKDDATKEKAREMFIVHQITVREISKRTGISERTLYNWKKEGEWERERTALTSAEQALDVELFELARTMSRGIRKDLEDGEKVDEGRYFAMGRLIESANKAREYSKEAVPPSDRAPMSPEEVQAAIVATIEKALGL